MLRGGIEKRIVVMLDAHRVSVSTPEHIVSDSRCECVNTNEHANGPQLPHRTTKLPLRFPFLQAIFAP
jgi:hypothetical protein